MFFPVKLISDEDVNDCFSSSFGRSKNAENPSLSPLNAHQMAEIFEQANTIAVRIELANARRRTCSADASGAETSSPVGNKVNDEFSPDGIIVTDEHLKAATSTPANQVVPDVNAHFWRADLEKSLCLEMDEKATVVSREQPTAKKQMQLVGRMKQLSTDTNQGKTLVSFAMNSFLIGRMLKCLIDSVNESNQ